MSDLDDDPRIVPDTTRGARWIVYAGVPVGVLAIAVVYTVGLSWGDPRGLCPTWLAFLQASCH